MIATSGLTYTVSIAASASLSSIEAAINGTSGLGSTGAVTATDDGSGHLVLSANNPNTSFTLSGAEQSAFRPRRQRGHRNEHDPRDAAGQLQCPAHPDRSARRGRFLQRRQSARRKQSAGALQRDRDERAEYQRREFQLHGAWPSTIAAGGFQNAATITSTESGINAAIGTVRAQTETFGTNASTIQTRQDFEKNMINTLQTGASNLVLADQNQESANLLTLQTQRQLEISALSIANQANQSVLKLFP